MIGSVLKEIEGKRLARIAFGADTAHDDDYGNGEMASMAECYVARACGDIILCDILWPWSDPMPESQGNRSDLVIAASFIIAEIERIDRMAAAHG